MTIKLEVGKTYELNNGYIYECTEMNGDSPLRVDDCGYGPFVIDSVLYHQDGRFGSCDKDHELSVKREVKEVCEAEKRGYKKVVITGDICGWPVGSIRWYDGNGEAFNGDCSEMRYHTVGYSCKYVEDDECEPKEETPDVNSQEKTYKTWGEMTPEEKGELLLAHYEGKTIEIFFDGGWEMCTPIWTSFRKYRVKPEPTREIVELYGTAVDTAWGTHRQEGYDTHKITFDVVDGEPDCSSVRMEELSG